MSLPMSQSVAKQAAELNGGRTQAQSVSLSPYFGPSLTAQLWSHNIGSQPLRTPLKTSSTDRTASSPARTALPLYLALLPARNATSIKATSSRSSALSSGFPMGNGQAIKSSPI